MDHAFKHLGGCYYIFPTNIGFFYDIFLQYRNFLKGNFHTKVAAGNHNTVRGINNRINVFDSLGAFYLADNTGITAHAGQQCAQLMDVFGISHKGRCNKIKTQLRAENEVVFVTLTDKRHRKHCPGNIYAFSAGNRAAHNDFAMNVSLGYFLTFQFNISVIYKNSAAFVHILDQSFIGNGCMMHVPLHFIDGQGKALSAHKRYRTMRYIPQTNFGPFCIQKSCNRNIKRFSQLHERFKMFLMVFVCAVRKVETSDIHATLNQPQDHLFGVCCRPDGAYDFCFPHSIILSC